MRHPGGSQDRRDPWIAAGCPLQLYLAGCWIPQQKDDKATLATIGIPQQDGMLRSWDMSLSIPSCGSQPWHTYLLTRGSHQCQYFHPPEHWWWCDLLPCTQRFSKHCNLHENARAHMTRLGDLYRCGSCWEDDTKDF